MDLHEGIRHVAEVAVVVIKPFPGERQDCLSGEGDHRVLQRASERAPKVGVGAVDVAQPAKQGRVGNFGQRPERAHGSFPVFQDDLALQESQIVRTNRRLNKAPESKDPFPIVCEVQ